MTTLTPTSRSALRPTASASTLSAPTTNTASSAACRVPSGSTASRPTPVMLAIRAPTRRVPVPVPPYADCAPKAPTIRTAERQGSNHAYNATLDSTRPWARRNVSKSAAAGRSKLPWMSVLLALKVSHRATTPSPSASGALRVNLLPKKSLALVKSALQDRHPVAMVAVAISALAIPTLLTAPNLAQAALPFSTLPRVLFGVMNARLGLWPMRRYSNATHVRLVDKEEVIT